MAPESVPKSATERRARRTTTKKRRVRRTTLDEYVATGDTGYDVLPAEVA
jgi:hypothetical protein